MKYIVTLVVFLCTCMETFAYDGRSNDAVHASDKSALIMAIIGISLLWYFSKSGNAPKKAEKKDKPVIYDNPEWHTLEHARKNLDQILNPKSK